MMYGLTCISEILKDQNKEFRFKTMTRKRFNELPFDVSISTLSERILHNLIHVKRTIEHCHSIGISHYRIPESFPLMTDPTLRLTWDILPDYDQILLAMRSIGDTSRKLNIRVGCHPDQFVILCSKRPDVCEKSIQELNQVSWFFDQMGLPQSHKCPINIHPSCSPKDETPEEVVDRFYTNLMKCDVGVQRRLTVENEDRGFFNCENLYKYFHVYMKKKYNFTIPLVWDNLHDSINKSPRILFESFASTWPNGVVPVMHLSEGGKNGNQRSHSDFITLESIKSIPSMFKTKCVWEVEVKAKDKAIIRLLSNS
jgi:UV DNA damage endonuclease